MNFELDVNNNAEIKVVIDKESGVFLSGQGAGNILMEIGRMVNSICGEILSHMMESTILKT